jgi:hypothetical protein
MWLTLPANNAAECHRADCVTRPTGLFAIVDAAVEADAGLNRSVPVGE